MEKRGLSHGIKMLCGIFILCSALPLLFGSEGIHGDAGAGGDRDVSAGVPERLREAPRVALTFDDGPGLYTGKLLDGLRERGVKATFFLIGQYAEQNPELVKRMDEEGHLIGNHTYHHVELTHLSAEEALYEITQTDKVVFSITGKHIRYVRPPFGAWKQGLDVEREMLPVLWTVDPKDWTTGNVDEIVKRVVTDTEENDIILLHDCYDTSVEAALRIVDTLTAAGYEFVTVEELIMD